MKVGTICKLKVDCLGNKAGTLGVVFEDYGDGFQVIFENGNYDGFSIVEEITRTGTRIEAEYFLEEVGFEATLLDYQFKSVQHVLADYRKGLFNIAWSEGWKNYEAGRASVAKPEQYQCDDCGHKFDVPIHGEKKPGTDLLLNGCLECGCSSYSKTALPEPEYEKCEVYADNCKPPWLRFTRYRQGVPTENLLSAAMDYADFSHFEYADVGKSLEPRRIQTDSGVIERTICPLYVVFRKKL